MEEYGWVPGAHSEWLENATRRMNEIREHTLEQAATVEGLDRCRRRLDGTAKSAQGQERWKKALI